MEPIHVETTSEKIARRLRQALADGGFTPGERLAEVELSEQLGVSRGVLREALQRLAQEGLVISRPNHGVFVRVYEADDVFDIYLARLALERTACFVVMDSTAGYEELADALDELTDELEFKAQKDRDVRELVSLDINFHERLVAEANSQRLSAMHATLATETRMCTYRFASVTYPVQSRISDHRDIAEAIRHRRNDDLNRLLARHMDSSVETILESFQGEDAEE